MAPNRVVSEDLRASHRILRYQTAIRFHGEGRRRDILRQHDATSIMTQSSPAAAFPAARAPPATRRSPPQNECAVGPPPPGHRRCRIPCSCDPKYLDNGGRLASRSFWSLPRENRTFSSVGSTSSFLALDAQACVLRSRFSDLESLPRQRLQWERQPDCG